MKLFEIRMLLGAIWIVFALPATAADTGTQPQEQPTRALVYSGFDFNSQSAYTGYIGGNFAPWGDLETSVFRFSARPELIAMIRAPELRSEERLKRAMSSSATDSIGTVSAPNS